MLDGVSLDQLRTFIAAADEGSFSAGGRRLRRAQSVVSQTLANLEAQLGVMVDVMFPLEQLTSAVAAFQAEFPATPLTLHVEALGAVLQPAMEGRCAFGVMGTLPTAPAELTREQLLSVGMAFVASPTHPLASLKGAIPARVLAQHRQLVLTDRSELSQGKDFGVFSANTWRLADLGAKHAFLRAGLGWGGMPAGVVEAELANGSLVKIRIEDLPEGHLVMAMSAVFKTDTPPGPAGRWLIERLKSKRINA